MRVIDDTMTKEAEHDVGPSHASLAPSLKIALAYTGVVIGYMPLLTLLLPIEVARIAGPAHYAALALVLSVGAATAAAANLLFGWLSDRARQRGIGRRRWMIGGLAAMLAAYAASPLAGSLTMIVIIVTVFQISINAIIAPLMALVAEEVPSLRIGFTTGLFTAGPLAGAMISLAISAPMLCSEGSRLLIIAAASAACLLPLIAMQSRAANQTLMPAPRPIARRDLAIAWMSRLLVQIAGNVVFADLLYLMEPSPILSAAGVLSRISILLLLTNLLPLPIALILGRWSDQVARFRPFLFGVAATAAVGLAVMAWTTAWNIRATAFLVFATGWGVFLPLQVGGVVQILPNSDHRGRDLAVLNLANTLPVLLGQTLTWRLVARSDATALLLALAALMLAGGMLTLVGSRVASPRSQPGAPHREISALARE